MSVLSTKRPLYALEDPTSSAMAVDFGVAGKRVRKSMSVQNFHRRENLLKEVEVGQSHVSGASPLSHHHQLPQNTPASPPQHRITAVPRTPRSPTSMAAALATAPVVRNVDMSSYRSRTYSWDEVVKIVDAAVREREGLLRKEYETVVQEKLAEQFQSFTQFNQDYIHRQLRESQFNYMS
ncbi:hypothetical protein BC936DRAFT_146747 [Jimgerdemannia flammicorona]|uniref:Akirin n=1 Tax=Jimgerdemannia flammicorona TaxID=994334 RepID=A0A433D6V6_9FUNG|nr:hypothetical protein BC936DRAFT_146747 [Jimgerdemannia flammicorona]